MAVTYIYEFLYRGVAPGSQAAPAFHVQLGGTVTDPLSGAEAPWVSPQLNVAQAEAAGWPVAKCLATINTEALRLLDQVRSQIETLQRERDDSVARAAVLEAQNKTLAAKAAEPPAVAPTS